MGLTAKTFLSSSLACLSCFSSFLSYYLSAASRVGPPSFPVFLELYRADGVLWGFRLSSFNPFHFWGASLPDLYCRVDTVDPDQICFSPLYPLSLFILTLGSPTKLVLSGCSPAMDNISIYLFLSVKPVSWRLSVVFIYCAKVNLCPVLYHCFLYKVRVCFLVLWFGFGFFFKLLLFFFLSRQLTFLCRPSLPILTVITSSAASNTYNAFPHPLVPANSIVDINVVAYGMKFKSSSSFGFRFFSWPPFVSGHLHLNLCPCFQGFS